VPEYVNLQQPSQQYYPVYTSYIESLFRN